MLMQWFCTVINTLMFRIQCAPQPDENKHLLALQFSWKNGIKPKGSIFIGVSPEFEFALYTLCFITSPNERVKVSFSLYDVEIVCHHYNQKHIGTTYPVLIRYQDVQWAGRASGVYSYGLWPLLLYFNLQWK